jgi:hypothetical protein
VLPIKKPVQVVPRQGSTSDRLLLEVWSSRAHRSALPYSRPISFRARSLSPRRRASQIRQPMTMLRMPPRPEPKLMDGTTMRSSIAYTLRPS